jgi:Ca-activated chloride channel family protein
MLAARTLALFAPISLQLGCFGAAPAEPTSAARPNDPREGLLNPSGVLPADEPRCGDLGPQRQPTAIGPADPVRARLAVVDGDVTLALPLKSTELRTLVVGTIAETTVVQTFHNPLQRPIDVLYTYPLRPGAVVDDFRVRVGPRDLLGEVRRHRADARAPANRFAQAIADVPQGAVVEVRLHIVESLAPRGGRYHLVLPTAVDAPTVAGDPGTRSCGNLDLHVELATGVAPTDLRSESHALLLDPASADTIKLALARELRPDRDLELSWRLAGDVPRAHLMSQRTVDGTVHLALAIHPPREFPAAAARPRELVLVFDASPRIPGPARALAREAVRTILADLGPADTFQILRVVADASTTFTPAPVRGSDDHRARALAFLDAPADGEASVLAGITAALTRPSDPDRLRILVFLGDGALAGESTLYAALARLRGDARLFALGVGDHVHRPLLAGIARLGRGVAVFAEPGDVSAAVRLREHLGRPVLTDIQVDWGGLAVTDVAPAELPDLHLGGLVVVHARLLSPARGARDPKISGTLGATPFTAAVRPDDRSLGGRNGLAVAWARRRVDEVFTAPEVSATRGPDGDGERLVTDLGLQHRLTTPYTALFAVDTRKARSPRGDTRTIQLAADLPATVPQPWPVFAESWRVP